MPNIKTWQERMYEAYGNHAYGYKPDECMKAEIAELRAALASSATNEPSDLAAAILALPFPAHGYGQMSSDDIFRSALTAAAALAKQVPAQEQDKIDAQRYRWLRDQDIDSQVGRFTPYAVEVIQGQTNKMLDGKELDEACDKAIAAQLAQSADTAEGDHA